MTSSPAAMTSIDLYRALSNASFVPSRRAAIRPTALRKLRVGAAIQNPDVITAILAAVHSDKWFIPTTGPPGHPAPHEPIAT